MGVGGKSEYNTFHIEIMPEVVSHGLLFVTLLLNVDHDISWDDPQIPSHAVKPLTMHGTLHCVGRT
jgi:hypothetical protein